SKLSHQRASPYEGARRMYEVNMALAKVMAPPAFPKEGRLPGTERAVGQNYGLQMREANRFKQSRDENGRSQHAKCCQAVHISLFFDGTNNSSDDTRAKRAFMKNSQFFIKDLMPA